MDVKRPIISEKSLGLASRGWYTFAVEKNARKEKIAHEVAAMYHVNVLTVRTVAVHGKVRRTGKKMISARKSDWKKAIVLLKAGQKIDAFEVTSKPAEDKGVAGKETKIEESKSEKNKDVAK